MNHLLVYFYTVQTVIMQEDIIAIVSKLIAALAASINLMNLIFILFIKPEEKIKGKANLKIMQNICISTAISLWSVYFFKPNVMYQFFSQLFKELNVYNWYLLRSIELIIALAVLTWLLKYSVKQIKVVYKTKKVVVLKLSKTR
ncbi:hypothetical protein R6Z02_14750 [Carnobacterium maltaromaticum]|uniref:hypothetical protein n=1 Tax=Carnobacterium maltaromaticum TaxID=2751 RepID=UPI00298A41F7|nr:hypothetical protein [Carnobacterium maltaromaticum]MDW5525013.1 hypothetical protein [Carnobacterium maltaromaticum]